jgi:hypothetical protein
MTLQNFIVILRAAEQLSREPHLRNGDLAQAARFVTQASPDLFRIENFQIEMPLECQRQFEIVQAHMSEIPPNAGLWGGPHGIPIPSTLGSRDGSWSQ